jgi:predicted MFS family arabinose efflux permease
LVGRLIETRGGRPVLAGSAVVQAAGLAVIGLAPSLAVFLAGWVVLGLAMGAGLYDPVFAALGRLYGERARGPITQVTLWGGFASTVCWPLTAFLVHQVGWRGACLVYALIALGVICPLYWFGMPAEATRSPLPPAHAAAGHSARRRTTVMLYATAMTLAMVITTVVSVELIALLEARGLSLAEAVGLGALFGPAQVGARALEAVFGHRHHPIWTLVLAAVGSAAGLAMLAGGPTLIAAGLILYGAANGIRSIARGTVPLALAGQAGYAALMGKLALPMLVAQAASPAIGALLMRHWGPDGTLATLCTAALCGVALTAALLPRR